MGRHLCQQGRDRLGVGSSGGHSCRGALMDTQCKVISDLLLSDAVTPVQHTGARQGHSIATRAPAEGLQTGPLT